MASKNSILIEGDDEIYPITYEQNVYDSQNRKLSDKMPSTASSTNKLVTQSDLPVLQNTTGQSTSSSMTQKAITDELTNRYTKSETSDIISNSNLLINSDFRINQLGREEYVVATSWGAYLPCADKWYLYGNVGAKYNANTKTLTGATWILTELDKDTIPINKPLTITLSANQEAVTAGTHLVFRKVLSSGNVNVLDEPVHGSDKYSYTFSVDSNDDVLKYQVIYYQEATATSVLNYIKLEVSPIPTMYTPRTYEEELALCQIPYDSGSISTIYSNPNLLINSDFKINQRGQSSYTGSKKYTVDRWMLRYGGKLDVLDNGNVKLTANDGTWRSLNQPIENYKQLLGKTLTFSVNYKSNGVIQIDIDVYRGTTRSTIVYTRASHSDFAIERVIGTIPNDNTITGVEVMIFVQHQDNDAEIEWAKLEIGSVSTTFSPRTYGEELVLCQRYYQIRSNIYTIESKAIDRPIPMRADGIIGTTAISETTYNTVDAEIY